MKTFRIYSRVDRPIPMVVKVGISWPAFIIGPLWFLLNRMWLNFAIVTALLLGGNLYFEYHKASTPTESLLFLGMFLLFAVA